MKKKAFTLTELLVVVVIIGVLSAVVLPKFVKVLETRKTTEAENIMAAVRNEQEARCTLDKDYTADTTKLASLPSGGSKHYSYSLDARGITATGDGYVLRMPSYTDGRICCEGDCDKINKDYPLCSSFEYQEATCSVPVAELSAGSEMDCTPGATESQQCLECGEQTHTCLEDGTWGEWSECPAKPASRTCSACGETVEATCNASTNTWDEPDMSLCKSASACPKACPEESKPKEEDACTPEGYEEACGKKTRSVTCNTTTGQWEAPEWDTITCQTTNQCKKCDQSSKPQDQTRACTPEGLEKQCGTQHLEYICSKDTNYQWQAGAEGDWSACEPTEECDKDLPTCSDWEDPDTGDFAGEACYKAHLSFDEDDLERMNTPLSSVNAPVDEVIARCCSSCPDGYYETGTYAGCCPNGTTPVQISGKNWACSKFTPTEVTLTAFYVLGEGGWKVYSNYTQGGHDSCDWTINGTTVGRRTFSSTMCLSCDASQPTCNMVYADETEYRNLPNNPNQITYGSSSKSNAECEITLRTESYAGYEDPVLTNDSLLCGSGGNRIYEHDFVSTGAGCKNGCGGSNVAWRSWSYSSGLNYGSGGGGGYIDVCLHPKAVPIKGYSCVAVQ